jgi:hypothetical protein
MLLGKIKGLICDSRSSASELFIGCRPACRHSMTPARFMQMELKAAVDCRRNRLAPVCLLLREVPAQPFSFEETEHEKA